jgi:hypothetical protein
MDKEFKSGVMLSMWQEWGQLNIKKFNWSTFHLIHMSFEFDKLVGDLEFMVIILGLGLRLRIPYETELGIKTNKELNATIKKLDQAFYGYAYKDSIEAYKNSKKQNSLIILKKKPKGKQLQKLFIQ